MERLLEETIATGQRQQLLKRRDIGKVNVDTTVQEKAVAHPTDARLYQKARIKLVKAAKERGIKLRQSYRRLGKEALRKQGRYAHAKQYRRARKMTRKLRGYLGRVMRDIERNGSKPDLKLARLLEVSGWIYEQKRKDKNKVYAVHALEVECISKGKAHKRYEFGCKVSVASSSKNNWVMAVDAIHSNPYDGHTLAETLESAEEDFAVLLGLEAGQEIGLTEETSADSLQFAPVSLDLEEAIATALEHRLELKQAQLDLYTFFMIIRNHVRAMENELPFLDDLRRNGLSRATNLPSKT
jgi:hypothetical protein